MQFRNIAQAAALAAAVTAILPAQAANIGVFGSDDFGEVATLSSLGHTINSFSFASPDASNLAGLNVAILLRGAVGNSALSSFVSNGGLLITEWDAGGYGISLLGGSASANYTSYLLNDAIVFTSAGTSLGLGTGLGASYTAQGASEFFLDFNTLGTGTVLANRGSNGATAIVGGKVGSGYVFVNGFDWYDEVQPNNTTLLNNQINSINVSAVPEPESYALLLAGLGVVGFVAKRRKAG